MSFDWGDGDYSSTGRQLEPVSTEVVAAAALRRGEYVLDVGCGDGNAALAAARYGAKVSGIDPSARLVALARGRAEALGLDATFAVGEAAFIDAPNGAFDVLFAIFSVIFADDPGSVVNELVRVTKPAGRVFITTWVPEGAVQEVVKAALPPDFVPPVSPWHSVDGIGQLFAKLPVDLTLREASVALEAESPAACIRQWEESHPFWRKMRAEHPDWEGVVARSVEILSRYNEAPGAFRVTSRYRVIALERRSM